jgi:hypothetical protein
MRGWVGGSGQGTRALKHDEGESGARILTDGNSVFSKWTCSSDLDLQQTQSRAPGVHTCNP